MSRRKHGPHVSYRAVDNVFVHEDGHTWPEEYKALGLRSRKEVRAHRKKVRLATRQIARSLHLPGPVPRQAGDILLDAIRHTLQTATHRKDTP